MGFRLIRLALLSLLPRSSFSATETTPDDDAGLVTMEKVLATSPPPDDVAFESFGASTGDEKNSSIWGNGKFILQRSQVVVPSGEVQAYWYCSGGQGDVNNRLMLFEPNVTFDEIAINTRAWQDPIVDDWNATLNAHAFSRVELMSFSGNNNVCGCGWFQLNFGEWLRSNSNAGSSIATDLYQTRNAFPPLNWYFPPEDQYLSSDYDPWVIQEVYTGEPLSSVSSGWHPPTRLEGTSPTTTTNRYLRIKNVGGHVTLRVMSNSPRAYGIVAYLFKENPDPSDQQDNGPINPMELYADGVSDVTEATAMTFASIPQGYYYSIFIRNNFEDQTKFFWNNEDQAQSPNECTMGPNGLSTQYDITYSLQTCAEAACNAGTIIVFDTPPTSSVAKAVVGRVSMLMTIAALFANISTA